MKLLKGVSLISLVFSLTLWVVLSAQAESQAPTADVIPEAEIRAVIDRYVDRFKALDIDGFTALFSREAVENRARPYPDMVEEYRRTFAMTNQFLYHLDIHAIQSYTKSAFVSGRYEIIQTTKPDNEMRTYQGNIQWTLVREEGALKILRVNYGKDSRRERFWTFLDGDGTSSGRPRQGVGEPDQETAAVGGNNFEPSD